MLPEDEQRQLQQIEQALCRDNPKSGRLMRALDPLVRRARTLILLEVVTGAGVLTTGWCPTMPAWRRPAR